MPVIYSNNASTTLSAGINNSTTTVPIASASGFPSIGSGEYYFATIANTNNTKIEVVKVTAGTTSLTVTRAQDGTTAQAFSSGDNFQLRVTAATLEASTKTDVNITAGAIAGAAISNDAIDSQHYADGSIDTAHIADSQVTTVKIGADAVTGAKIADDSIDSEHYVNGSIDTAHIANDQITQALMADDAIGSPQIAAGGVDTTAIGSNAVTTAKIADDAITAAKIGNDAINHSDMIADGVIKSEHYEDGSIDTAHIADDQVTADKLANSINTDIATGVAALPKSGGTMTGDLILGDNVRLEVGSLADGDLAIYHDTNHSQIEDRGTGNLYVKSNGAGVHIQGKGGEESVVANGDGSVELYYDNAKKLETTSNGIKVTDRVTGSSDLVLTSSDSNEKITLNASGYIDFETDGAVEMRLEADGDLHVDGDIIAFSTTISDATLKYDINPIDHALEKIGQLKGVTYKYLKDGMESAGLLAQDVEKVMPCAVNERKLPLHKDDGKSYKTLNYDNLHALLIESIKELTAKVEKLENK